MLIYRGFWTEPRLKNKRKRRRKRNKTGKSWTIKRKQRTRQTASQKHFSHSHEPIKPQNPLINNFLKTVLSVLESGCCGIPQICYSFDYRQNDTTRELLERKYYFLKLLFSFPALHKTLICASHSQNYFTTFPVKIPHDIAWWRSL